MSEATRMYRNPDAPVGYVYQEKKKKDDSTIAILLKILETLVSDSDSDSESDIFRIMTPEESSEEEIENDDQNAAADTREKPTNKEMDDKKSISVASTSSSVIFSPVKSEKRSRSSDERRERRYSDASSESSHRSRSMSRRHSPVRIKQETMPEHLFGSYHCDVCNLTLNSKATYDSHIIGKRHQKACNKAMNIVDTVARSVPSTSVESKKPLPSPGVVRVKIKKEARIQELVDAIDTPLPGLHYVTEIWGFSEISYYCSLCDAPCSGASIQPHLRGFKHTLKCLKMFKPDVYEQINYKPKYQIEDKVKRILMSVEMTEGRGKISVEAEKFAVESGDNVGASSYISAQPSTSRQPEYMDFNEYYDQTTIPDTSKSGFYCRLCESHMNSPDMWQNHIGGKRHLANARKMPGSIPSKIKNIPMKDVRANLMDLLEGIDTPVVGLNHIRETQNRQTRKDMYQCYLCGACLNTNDIVDHVISHKHRVKYLQEIKHECLAVITDMDINGPNAVAIVVDACATMEEKHGPGNPNVFFSKDFFPPALK